MSSAIISDIHANLEALNTCIQYIDEHDHIQQVIVLGDIVGYGANPNECIETVKSRMYPSIIGNHDAAVLGRTKADHFNTFARRALIITDELLHDDNRTYLSELPYTLSTGGIYCVHGTPEKPERWDYIFSAFDAVDQFGHFSEFICFVGHSHVPGIYTQAEQIDHMKGNVSLKPDERYLVNIGSIGQPRDGDHRLSFAVYNSDEKTVEIVRLEYDVRSARQKIIDAGLPQYLGDRLLTGR